LLLVSSVARGGEARTKRDDNDPGLPVRLFARKPRLPRKDRQFQGGIETELALGQRNDESAMTALPSRLTSTLPRSPRRCGRSIEQVRATIRRAVPEAVEGIGYRMPGYKLHGKPMLYFAGFKEHYSLFAASGTFFAVLEDELRGYELRKGTVHFPLTKPVPVKLISRIAKLRAAGIAAMKKPLLGREKEKGKSAQ